MKNTESLPSSIFKDGKYQREYLNHTDEEQDFETELAFRWLAKRANKEKKLDEKLNSGEVDKALTASHYTDAAFGYQFVQLAAELTRNMEPSEAAIASHIYKYVMRLGRKDDSIQDAGKAIMWLKIYIQ